MPPKKQPKSEDTKSLEYRILKAKVTMNEAGAQIALAAVEFIPQLFKRLIQEFEKDFGSPFNPNKPSSPPSTKSPASPAASIPFNVEKFEKAPCYLCGYKGESYYDPKTHSCAEFYHKAVEDGHGD